MSDEPMCGNCIHRQVCKIHGAIGRFLKETFTDQDTPFHVDEMAYLCRYGPKFAVAVNLNMVEEVLSDER